MNTFVKSCILANIVSGYIKNSINTGKQGKVKVYSQGKPFLL